MAAFQREPIYAALFALTAGLSWTGYPAGFVTRSRRVKLFNEVLPTQQPALFQAEHDEQVSQVTRMPYKWVLKADWIVYQAAGHSPNAVPAQLNNLILDALAAALAPKPTDEGFPDERNTLGGLVHHCYADGTVFKDPGDIDNQGMMVIPILMLVP